MTSKRVLAAGLLAAAAVFAGAPGLRAAGGAEKTVKAVGTVLEVRLPDPAAKPAADKPVEAVVTVLVRGKKVEVVVRDELTLKKLRIKKINVEDEVRVQYRVVTEDGVEKNVAVTFRRSAGC